MPEFLELLETIHAEEASADKLFGDAGHRMRGKESAQYKKKLIEAVRIVTNAMDTGSHRAMARLEEAMSTSDFPYLFGDILDRSMLTAYRAWPKTYPNYVSVKQVRDFREVKRLYITAPGGVLDQVVESDEYPAAEVSDGQYTYSVKKYGRRVPFTWETWINDDLDALKNIPNFLAMAASRTEEKFATELFVDESGPHASLYTSGNGNIITGNPTLGVTGLQTAMSQLAAMTDENNEPIMVEMVDLVVPPGLEQTALMLVNAITFDVDPNAAAGTAQTVLRVQNYLKSRIRVHVNPYIPVVASTANGATSWFLFASPADGRPALEMGFLRGHVEPELFMKASNMMRINGGMADPSDGSFINDSIEYKLRHVFGGGRMDPKKTVASNGTKS